MHTHTSGNLRLGIVRSLALAGGIVSGTAAFNAAYAQSLDEIVVTANRRAENLQDVPVAITAIGGEALERMGVDTTADLPNVTPGLLWITARASSTPFLRGVGTLSNGATSEGPTAMYLDGVYMASQNAAVMSLSSVDRIEVLKGPQGTLFGRNATGGLINVITRDPSQEFRFDAEAGYANYDTTTLTAYMSGGVTENLAGDLTVGYSDQGEGYGYNVTINQEVDWENSLVLRNKWLWTPGDSTRIGASFDYSKSEGDRGRIYNIWENSYGSDGVQWGQRIGIHDTAAQYDQDGETTQWGATLRADQELAFGKVVSISSFRNTKSDTFFDPDQTPRDVNHQLQSADEETFTQELQLLSPDSSSVQWIAGLFYMHRDVPGTVILNQFRPAAGQERISEVLTTSKAVFGQATFPLVERTNLTLGARYTSEDQDWEGKNRSLTTPVYTLWADVNRGADVWTYRVALDHELSDDTMIYAAFNSGFNGGTLPGFGNLAAEPEYLDAYEVGMKSDLLDNRLRLNSVAFYYDYQDLQVEVVQAGVTDNINAPSAEIYGVELELQAAVSQAFNLRGSVAYLHSEFKEFKNAPCFLVLPTGSAQYTCDATGHELIGAPELTVNLGGDYTMEFAGGSSLTLSGNIYNVSRHFWDVENRVDSDPYTLLNAGVEWRAPENRWTAKLWGKNLADTEYYAVGAPSGALSDRGRPGTAATYGLTLGMHF